MADEITINEGAKRTLTLERLFRCGQCGFAEVAPFVATPQHCGALMDVERDMFRGGDPDHLVLDTVRLRTREPQTFHGGANFLDLSDPWRSSHFRPPASWDPAFELWALHAGRERGERIGWFGKVAGAELVTIATIDPKSERWEFHMPPGVRSSAREGVIEGFEARDFLRLGDDLVPIEVVERLWAAINEG